ncbi:hypothetical protein Y032_0016g3145 [Ancylostoma ceylanicum]|uniref:Uncharacterized protein n=1 Tax=Ancylostoma ceylanicum TaxID=53326 RepID=A0A016V7A5_9BILA|nr:hypothetical protein Y032_0016g3145 [Ancylostoma ceylanicum]
MYELLLFVLERTVELYVPLSRKPLSGCRIPAYLQRLSSIRTKAWHLAKINHSTENVKAFEVLNDKFSKKLAKFNASVERKVIDSDTLLRTRSALVYSPHKAFHSSLRGYSQDFYPKPGEPTSEYPMDMCKQTVPQNI